MNTQGEEVTEILPPDLDLILPQKFPDTNRAFGYINNVFALSDQPSKQQMFLQIIHDLSGAGLTANQSGEIAYLVRESFKVPEDPLAIGNYDYIQKVLFHPRIDPYSREAIILHLTKSLANTTFTPLEVYYIHSSLENSMDEFNRNNPPQEPVDYLNAPL